MDLELDSVRIPFSGCQIWMGALDGPGYGVLKVCGVVIKAHRLSYAICVGPIPSGMLVCHTCDIRCCINPNHLFLGSNMDNLIDASRKGRLQVQFCKNGHPATAENRYVNPDGRPGYCKVCRRKPNFKGDPKVEDFS